MQTLIRRHLLAMAILLSVGLFALARATGIAPELAVTVASVLVFVAAMVLERVIPYRSAWNESRGDTRTDITSAVVLVAVTDPLLKYVAPLLVVSLYGVMNKATASFGENWPFVLQVLAVTLIAEFGRYWAHRAHHGLMPLWWLHAMHHSSERMYALNNLRFHPLNYAIVFMAGTLPVMLLGFSSDALLGYLAIAQPVLMLQHANLDLQSGWLNRIFSSNEVHRWHHATEPAEANTNFGNAIMLWDQVFGTWREPGFPDDQDVGLFAESSTYPGKAGYFAQLRSMLMPNCCATSG